MMKKEIWSFSQKKSRESSKEELSILQKKISTRRKKGRRKEIWPRASERKKRIFEKRKGPSNANREGRERRVGILKGKTEERTPLREGKDYRGESWILSKTTESINTSRKGKKEMVSPREIQSGGKKRTTIKSGAKGKEKKRAGKSPLH